jgi:hypothetical protein
MIEEQAIGILGEPRLAGSALLVRCFARVGRRNGDDGRLGQGALRDLARLCPDEEE